MAVVPGVFEILIIVFFGASMGGSGLPIGLPPAEHDSLLDYAAPDSCLGYLAWNATAEPDPQSPNKTERLLAERELQRFVEKTTDVLLRAMREEASRDENGRRMASAAPRLLRTLLTNATAIYISPGAPVPSGGLACRVGDKADDVERWLVTIQEIVAEQEAKHTLKSGSRVYTWPTAPDMPPIQWTIADNCLFVGIGEGELEALISRVKAEATPKWLARISERLPVDRQASTMHVNVAGIMEQVSPMLPQEAATGLRASGLQDILSVNTVTGLGKTDCVTRTWVRTTGRHTGLLTILNAAPLTSADMEQVPADVRLATIVRLEPTQLLKAGLKALEEAEPRAAVMARRALDESRGVLGLDLEEDILAAIGNTWRLYQSPSGGGDPILGWTAVVSLRKPDKIRDLTNTLKGFAAAQNQRHGAQVRIDTFDAAGRTAWFVNTIGEEMPIAPAWCITENELVVALYPQGITSWLTRDKSAKKLSELPIVQERLDTHAIAFSYCDTAALFDLAWPFIRGGATVLGSQLQREGLDLNISILPSRGSISRHLEPATTVLSATPDGFELTQHRTLPPVLEPVMVSSMMLFGFQAPMRRDSVPRLIGRALSPAASRRTDSVNNLKQLMLAMHNYHDTFKRFPKAVTADKEGNPGLSWRVHLLPFLDQAPLYNQFKLDEPWDSEHNRKLIPLMPAVFRAPGSQADAGMTNYVGFRGEGTIFEESEQGIRISQVYDGTSNTLSIVEADDEHAVIWSKPGDIEFDPNSPRKGLNSPTLPEGFLGALTDGSVRIIGPDTPDELIRRLVLRSDGQPIGEF